MRRALAKEWERGAASLYAMPFDLVKGMQYVHMYITLPHPSINQHLLPYSGLLSLLILFYKNKSPDIIC